MQKLNVFVGLFLVLVLMLLLLNTASPKQKVLVLNDTAVFHPRWQSPQAYTAVSHPPPRQSPPPIKSFLYLTQTEKCLREQMRPVTALGDSANCDILVLSFKEKCDDTSLSHVNYIFNSSTTFTSGRSVLYYTAQNLTTKYLYYIFIDDDISLVWVDQSKHLSFAGSPWRTFEKFLLELEPPLGALDNNDWDLLKRISKMRKQKNCTTNGVDPDYFVALWFDGTVNAFHHKAMEHLLEPVLPVWTRFDKTSWWFPQWYVNMMADVVYPGQTLLYNRVMSNNPKHRPYPKKGQDKTIIQQIANDVKSVLPPENRKAAEPVLEDWVTTFEIVSDIPKTVERTFCLPGSAKDSST